MKRPNRVVVGLAGTVAAGKSTVAALFRKLGAGTVDADAIAHDVLDRPGVRRALQRAFGSGILSGGRVDRRALAARAFQSADAGRRLNAIVHPHVGRALRARIRAARGVFIVEASLLQEAGADAWCDVVVLVDAAAQVRRERARPRGWPAGEMTRRERLQWSAAQKRAGADYVIENSGPLTDTRRQVRTLYKRFLDSLQQ